MALNLRVCSRARLARDARFDGKFFIGVLSTRIYCRPICRARVSRESNVRYFPTAAAAAEAGFRPCLRCRPECSPGTPARAGTRNTVSRALQLINESGLENGVEGLAERLGVTSRHLRRLFVHHLGATPSAVAQTRRLNFAKKLIDQTRLRMGEVALVSGFGSVRRFNATIRKVYHRTPTQIRRLVRRTVEQPQNSYLFHLDFRPPYNWKGVLEFLGAHSIPGVEVVEADRYSRTILERDGHGCFEVSLDAPKNSLTLQIQLSDPRSLFFVTERIRAMFDLDADWEVIARTLKTDDRLAAALTVEAGLRVPGCWNGFELTAYAILAQEGVKVATDLVGRIARHLGQPFSGLKELTHVFPGPEVLADTKLARIGLPKASAETIRRLARAICDQQIRFDGIVDTEDFRKRLCEVPGVEPETAEYVAMRALRDPDAFPTGNLVLRESIKRHEIKELEGRSQSWRPWRAYAAVLLWQIHCRTAVAPRPNRTHCSSRNRRSVTVPASHSG